MPKTPACWLFIFPPTPSATTASAKCRADGSAGRASAGSFQTPATASSNWVSFFGKDYCRFDEAVVRLYKPTASAAEIGQATNPSWPPVNIRQSGRKPFRYAPPRLDYDRHPAIAAMSDAMRIQNYSFKTFKNYKQALIALIRYAEPMPLDALTKAAYQKYLLFLRNRKRLSSSTLNVHINGWKFYQEKVLGRDKTYFNIDLPRQPTKLPTVYSVAEVKTIFNATTSLKYRTLF